MSIKLYIYKFILLSILIIFYYRYIKLLLVRFAAKIPKYFFFVHAFPKKDIEGTIELALIASSHVIFCVLLYFYLYSPWPGFCISYLHYPIYAIYGILLGIGCMGFSGLLSKISIQIIGFFNPSYKYDLKTWLTISRGGWIKHHLQSLEILPIYLSVVILAMQVGSEEVIFRSIITNYFAQFGKVISILTSCTWFVFMQAFLMSRWQTAIFPMIGALVMGVMHSILYMHVPIIWPLIISHITFFLFSVI